jgi:hypothetical protein
MCEKLEKYKVQIPKDLELSYKNFKAFELKIRCKICNNESIRHFPNDFTDIAVLSCLCCGKEKWVPIYGLEYSLTAFDRFLIEKFNMKNEKVIKKRELSYLYDAAFEAYCEACDCGGRFRRSALCCVECGAEDVEVINSDIYWQDNFELIKQIKIEWLIYYTHPF